MIKVSVLVPIYNVEKYLPECLNSLAAQTLPEIEIVCINDGSTDNSPKIVQKYAKKDTRIVVLDKENTGYGDSMNQGLAKAKGKYIAIVEPDDFIETDACEKLYEIAQKHEADIVRGNYYYHTAAGDELHRTIRDQFLYHPQKVLEDPAILYEEPAIWSAIYRRKFLQEHGIRFLPTPGASYQDTGFNMKALCAAERIVYTERAFLHYRTDNSDSSVKSLEKADYVLQEYADVERFLDEIKAPRKLRYIVQAAKFGAFHWNLIRLPRSLALIFATKMKLNFREAEVAGLLQREYWPRKYWLALQIILRMPVRVYYTALEVRGKLRG